MLQGCNHRLSLEMRRKRRERAGDMGTRRMRIECGAITPPIDNHEKVAVILITIEIVKQAAVFAAARGDKTQKQARYFIRMPVAGTKARDYEATIHPSISLNKDTAEDHCYGSSDQEHAFAARLLVEQTIGFVALFKFPFLSEQAFHRQLALGHESRAVAKTHDGKYPAAVDSALLP